MPKKDIIHPERTPLSDELNRILLYFFDESDLERLEKLGGRIQVKIAAPYKDSKKRKEKIIINEEYVESLLEDKKSIELLKVKLSKLNRNELKELAGLFKQPIRSNATSSEIRTELLKTISSDDIWDRISGRE